MLGVVPVPSQGSAGRTAALSGPSVSVRPPSSFVLGDRAVISGRAAAWLTSRAGLAELRARVRGDDPDIDQSRPLQLRSTFPMSRAE